MGKIILLFWVSMIAVTASGQAGFELSGQVVDENNQPLPGAAVVLHSTEKGAVTNLEGGYSIKGLTAGIYSIEISFMGYKPHTDTIQISKDEIYNAQLAVALIGLEEVVINDNYSEQRKREEPLSREIINDTYLKQHLGGSLMKSLERLPGVSTIDIGSGQSKPLIRGLGFNRVVVVENGIKHEGQQWGADHGLEIDQYAVNHLEVIKGPASLRYGSDAIGGVIDVKQYALPLEYTVKGEVDLVGKTNNNLLGTSLFIAARKKSLFASFRATLLDYGDYKVPTDSVDIYSYRAPLYEHHLRNTAGREHDLHGAVGYVGPTFQTTFLVSNVNSKSGFFANAHGLEPRNVDADLYDRSSRDILYPFQQVNHFKVINKSRWQWDQVELSADLGVQRNFRQEWSQYTSHGYMPAVFPDAMDFAADLERQFDKYIYSGNIRADYRDDSRTSFTAGISSDYQDNQIDGRGFIIPAYRQLNIGSYFIAKHAFSKKSLLQLGLRYDYGHMATQSYSDWFSSPVDGADAEPVYLQRAAAINRYFSNFSWSLGYNYNLEQLSLKANVGKSFRMPIAKELAANGINYHHFSYEVGDPALSPEISYQLDLGVEYQRAKYAIGATPFFNYFPNYIYLNPTSEYDRLYGNGNQIYYYAESKVLRYGGEIHAHYQITAPLQLGLIGEYVYSEQLSGDKKGFTLPFSPPASLLFNIKYQKNKIRFIEHPYLSVDWRLASSQQNIVPPENPTDAYQVINLALGGNVRLYKQPVNVSLQVQNLLNQKYFNHTSYYRLINVPEAGRNLILNISVPFSGNIKRE
ncbi:MAG: TonB-dependent receptor [Lewinella sp.]|nr:TonB-dependent receptor [Lewinella sp.]